MITTPSGPRVVVVLTDGYGDYADVIALTAALALDAFDLSVDRFAAALSPLELSAVSPSQPFSATIQVTNTSNFAWDGTTFHLAARWRDPSSTLLPWDGAPAGLPPLAPGQTATVVFRGTAPAAVAAFLMLELDVIHDGIGWAGTPVRIPVIVSR